MWLQWSLNVISDRATCIYLIMLYCHWHASFSCAIFNWRIQNKKVIWAWPYGGSLSSTDYNILVTFNTCAKREVSFFNLSVKKIEMQPKFHKYGWLVVIHGYQQRQSLIHHIRYHFSERELTFTFAVCYRPSVCRLSVCRLSVCRLSSVCNVRAPYSGSSDFRQYFYGIRYVGHPWTSPETFTEIVPGEPLRRGS